MKRLLFFALLMSGSLSYAQSTLKTTATLTAACTTATTACDATANSQLKLPTGEYSMASITVHGTFTGVTLFFEFSDDGGTNWYPSTCTRNDAAIQEGSEAIADSTNRSFDCGTAAAGVFRIRQHAISTGTVLIAASQSAIQIEPSPTVSVTTPTPADGTSNTNFPGIEAANMLYNGSTWDAARNDSSKNLLVHINNGAGPLLTLQASQTSGILNATTTRATTTGLGSYQACDVLLNITGIGVATGVLQVYIQDSADGGTTWDDVISSNTFAFAATAVTQRFFLNGLIAATGTQGSAAAAETLAAGTVRSGPWGDRFRVREKVSGVSGSPTGATYTITAVCK